MSLHAAERVKRRSSGTCRELPVSPLTCTVFDLLEHYACDVALRPSYTRRFYTIPERCGVPAVYRLTQMLMHLVIHMLCFARGSDPPLFAYLYINAHRPNLFSPLHSAEGTHWENKDTTSVLVYMAVNFMP